MKAILCPAAALILAAAVSAPLASQGREGDSAGPRPENPPSALIPARKGPRGASDEAASPAGLPSIGMWMLAKDGSPADWLGTPFEGKRLLEPINVVIVDPFASSPKEAAARLLKACDEAEFPPREGHSSGYSARIGSEIYPQVPSEDSFSDRFFALTNDHGRIFGPMEWNGSYVFVGAFSRETVDVSAKVKHRFDSFNRARDAFAGRMSERAHYRALSLADLGNAIVGDAYSTTADHDGKAVVLAPER